MKLKNYLTPLLLLPVAWQCDSQSDALDGGIVDERQTKYYVNASVGLDSNSGNSSEAPYRSLYTLRYAQLKAGDTIFLARGVTHHGSIVLKNVSGTADRPIVITAYGDGEDYAHIDAKGNLAGIYMENCSHIRISGLRITADGAGNMSDTEARAAQIRCGIMYVPKAAGTYSDLTIEDVLIEDIYFHEQGYVRDNTDQNEEGYGYGIRMTADNANYALDGITIRNCQIRRVSRIGVLIGGMVGSRCVSNIEIDNLDSDNTGGPGIQISHAQKIHIHHSKINKSGSEDDSRNFCRGSGFWCFNTDRVLFEYNRMTNANGHADSAGAHIDYNCNNVIYQYNFSANNWGGFIEVLGNNYNCCYRYNVSVNDGQRKKGGVNQAGHTLWLSKYSGLKIGPFDTYIYNNTIYVDADKQSFVAMESTADGVYIANNIFHVMGQGTDAVERTSNTIMEHNLFYSSKSWSATKVRDAAPTYGDPMFANAGGLDVADYVPTNRDLVKDRGTLLSKLPGDEIGLFLGLKVETDILGNPVDDTPDFGAIELQ